MISEEESDRQANAREFSPMGKAEAKERDAADATLRSIEADLRRMDEEDAALGITKSAPWPNDLPIHQVHSEPAEAVREFGETASAALPPRPTVNEAMRELMHEYGLGVLTGCVEEEVAGLSTNDRNYVATVMKLAACKAIKELKEANK